MSAITKNAVAAIQRAEKTRETLYLYPSPLSMFSFKNEQREPTVQGRRFRWGLLIFFGLVIVGTFLTLGAFPFGVTVFAFIFSALFCGAILMDNSVFQLGPVFKGVPLVSEDASRLIEQEAFTEDELTELVWNICLLETLKKSEIDGHNHEESSSRAQTENKINEILGQGRKHLAERNQPQLDNLYRLRPSLETSDTTSSS